MTAAGRGAGSRRGIPRVVRVGIAASRVDTSWSMHAGSVALAVQRGQPPEGAHGAPRSVGAAVQAAKRAAAAAIAAASARLACALVLALFATSLPAAEPPPTEQDRATQARAIRLAEQLRCLVCQNQTIADSNADLAVDLRRQLREQIAAGRSDDDIIDFMTTRYGDFVLYRPPLKASTLLLWAGPALLLAIGAWLLARIVRERRAAAPPVLSADERARAQRLLDGVPSETDRAT